MKAKQSEVTYIRKEWIKGSPDPDEYYKILAFGEGYIFECEWDGESWTNIAGDSFTHWMPLPEPPQEK